MKYSFLLVLLLSFSSFSSTGSAQPLFSPEETTTTKSDVATNSVDYDGFQLHLATLVGVNGKNKYGDELNGYGQDEYVAALGLELHTLKAFKSYFAWGASARIYEFGEENARQTGLDLGGVFRARLPFEVGSNTIEPFVEFSGGLMLGISGTAGIGAFYGFDGGSAIYFGKTFGVHAQIGWRQTPNSNGTMTDINVGGGISLRL